MTTERKYRRPVHVGTRSWDDAEEATKCMIAVPVFRGEVITRIALDCFGVTRSAETNVDQPPVFSWLGGFVPMFFGNNLSITTAALDLWLRQMDSKATDGVYLGGEPNPSGDADFMGADMFRDLQVNFRRNVIGDPMPVALDELGNADARFVDRFRTVIDRDLTAESSGLWIFGGRSYRMDAQTDFGVAEVDTSITPADLALAYSTPQLAVSGNGPKAAELIWGGDNYIEADSFKETARRMYSICRPAIRLSGLYTSSRR